jgi:hypothetical protein
MSHSSDKPLDVNSEHEEAMAKQIMDNRNRARMNEEAIRWKFGPSATREEALVGKKIKQKNLEQAFGQITIKELNPNYIANAIVPVVPRKKS